MPKDLDQVASLAAKHVQVARMGITTQSLLNLQCETVHATTHVRHTSGQPNPHTAWRQHHPRSAVITRRNADRLTSYPTLISVPSGSLISIPPVWLRSVRGGNGTFSGRGVSVRR